MGQGEPVQTQSGLFEVQDLLCLVPSWGLRWSGRAWGLSRGWGWGWELYPERYRSPRGCQPGSDELALDRKATPQEARRPWQVAAQPRKEGNLTRDRAGVW